LIWAANSPRPLHQLRDIDPQRIALHLLRLKEGERLHVEVKPEPSKRGRVAVEKLWWLPSHYTVERGDALLAVEQQLHNSGRQLAVAPMVGCPRLRGPNKQTAHWVPPIERAKQGAHLVAVPHIAALKLGQGHVPAVNMVEDG
jgi:hypothetical protein